MDHLNKLSKDEWFKIPFGKSKTLRIGKINTIEVILRNTQSYEAEKFTYQVSVSIMDKTGGIVADKRAKNWENKNDIYSAGEDAEVK